MVKKIFSRIFKFQESQDQTIRVQAAPTGASGTDIFAGEFAEEYLQDLTGIARADCFDKMRRSDAIIAMSLAAVKNPLRSADWTFQPSNMENEEEAKKHADLVNHVFDNELVTTKKQTIQNLSSFIDFGHSLVERTHKIVENHPEFGTFNSLKALTWISPRTIERWNVDSDGVLETVRQCSFGDIERAVDIDAKFLSVLSINKEGDNYEGISLLRPCYGPYIRKSKFQKLNAIGVEKHAIPTPIATIPSGMEASEKADNLENFLISLTTHEKNYLMKPEGWELEFQQNIYNAANVNGAIEFENQEIRFAFLANFLSLGSGTGGGSFALSNDLSDFFLQGIEYMADIIAEALNPMAEELIRLNFGPQESYPKMIVSGISDKAGAEFATMMKALVDGKMLTPDDVLEDNLRKRLGLPDKDESTARETGHTPPPIPGGPIGPGKDEAPEKGAENPTQNPTQDQKTKKKEPLEKEADDEKTLSDKPGIMMTSDDLEAIKLAQSKARKQIVKAEEGIRPIFERNLETFAEKVIKQLMFEYKRLPDNNKEAAIGRVNAAVPAIFKKELKEAMGKTAVEATKEAQKEVPKAPKRFAEEDGLPVPMIRFIRAQSLLLATSTTNDMEKALLFQYSSSSLSTDSAALVEKDLRETMDSTIKGPGVVAASGNTASRMVNEARTSFFSEPEVLKEIETFTFTNPDPKSNICRNLQNKTFKKDDPDAGRFFPPLHHNCKSFISVNLVGAKNNPDLTGGGLRPTGSPEDVERALKSVTI